MITLEPPVPPTSVLTLKTSVDAGDHHSFRRFACSNCGHEINVPVYCGDRFCETCGRPRRYRVRARIRWLASRVKLPARHKLSHLVLTVPNSPEIATGLHQLLTSFRKLRHGRVWKKYVSGGAFVIEVTGVPGNWHVHLHALISNLYFPYKQLSAAYSRAGGGTYVWIERLRDRDIAKYLTKYLSKCEVAPTERAEVNSALKGCRLFQPFGCWYAASQGYKQLPCPCPICNGTGWIQMDFFSGRFSDFRSLAPPAAICYEDAGDRPGDEILPVLGFDFTLDRTGDLAL